MADLPLLECLRDEHPFHPRATRARPISSRPRTASLATAEGSLRIRYRDHQRHGIDRGLDKAVPLVEPLRLRGDRVHENGADSAELGGLQGPENCITQQAGAAPPVLTRTA